MLLKPQVPIDQLGALSSLKYLQLSQNKVGDTLPMEMTKLISLEELDLSVNKIKAIGPNCLPKGQRKEDISIHTNTKSHYILNILLIFHLFFSELSHLNISANEIAVLESNSDVFKCAHLEELLIANNKLTTISAQVTITSSCIIDIYFSFVMVTSSFLSMTSFSEIEKQGREERLIGRKFYFFRNDVTIRHNDVVYLAKFHFPLD